MVAIVFLLHYLRLRRIRERFAAVLEERNRVAREMHDTVIQGCSTVSVLLEASDSMQDDEQAAAELTGLARQQIQNTIREARQAILNLRQPSAEDENLVDGLRQITETASREFAQSVGLEITGESLAPGAFLCSSIVDGHTRGAAQRAGSCPRETCGGAVEARGQDSHHLREG